MSDPKGLSLFPHGRLWESTSVKTNVEKYGLSLTISWTG